MPSISFSRFHEKSLRCLSRVNDVFHHFLRSIKRGCRSYLHGRVGANADSAFLLNAFLERVELFAFAFKVHVAEAQASHLVNFGEAV